MSTSCIEQDCVLKKENGVAYKVQPFSFETSVERAFSRMPLKMVDLKKQE